MKHTHINRYEDTIIFERTDDNTVVMTCDQYNIRYSYIDETDTIDMVDPSGGPYITIGTDLQVEVDFPESFIVKSISFSSNKDTIIFNGH